jgi:RHS repeat-associated protein
MPISMTQDTQTYYLHYDQVGSLRVVTDANHNIVKEITYDTFGNILQDTNQNLNIPFGFAGGLQDQDTNLVHFGYREYDPQTGKWTAKDPIDFEGGDANLYGYVESNPVNFVDPEGLASSGVPKTVPGTTTKVRIDNPHVPGQQKHAHVYPKNGNPCVVNKDGTSSHGSKANLKNKKLLDYLKNKGFNLKSLPFMIPLTDRQLNLYLNGLIGPNGEDLTNL